MTPEEAKPTYRTEMNGGWEPTFTAEETAQIAIAYAQAFYYEDVSFMDKPAIAWREKFEEWCK